ncbi:MULTISPECIES: nuclear transport factor 2 family protein [Pseudofrankia]|uniref:nuclear transport factor 2 family protein n=1 Tax=Pseudofrankia TaxID=2994363 RepID=UPI000234B4B5|nr:MULTISPECIES: nuclear transport factor 2 family protein [Pseudofrankia]OHV36582.1 polyketide cyclase [Pseudofrankia sp. EUN1h]
MSAHETAVERYLAAWNATEPSGTAAAVAVAWADDGAYTDPLASVTGHREIFGLIGAVQAQFPGHRFRLSGTVDGHHDVARFGWELVGADGSAPVAGFDVLTLDPDGRIRSVIGFLDRVPAPAA